MSLFLSTFLSSHGNILSSQCCGKRVLVSSYNSRSWTEIFQVLTAENALDRTTLIHILFLDRRDKQNVWPQARKGVNCGRCIIIRARLF
jgi:hypothetical protein